MVEKEPFVALPFVISALGASAGKVAEGQWRIVYFDHVLDFFEGETAAEFDGKEVKLPSAPLARNDTLYVPWSSVAQQLGVKWSVAPRSTNAARNHTTTLLLQFPAARIEAISHELNPQEIRVTVKLSNATRISGSQHGTDVQFYLAAARQPGVPDVRPVNDYLLPRVVTKSGNWKASVSVRTSYSAPIQWYTQGSPPRLIINVQRLFEQQNSNPIGGGLTLTRIRRGTQHGPVQMFAVRVDPREGWRIRVTPAHYGVLVRGRPSTIASRHRAVLAVNGGFFAFDGAAVGAVLVDGEWIRLPWKGRTAIGFQEDGTARIGNMQAFARIDFSGGLQLPIRDLNGWPDKNRVSALTLRFSPHYRLKPDQIALVVRKGKVVSKPGSGLVYIPADGFILVADGGAKQWLNKVQRGENAKMEVESPGWEGFVSALGGGPRLLNNSQLEITALREAFRSDVRNGLGPRTALGIDSEGRYIILIVDGRQSYYSSGLTLTELANTMQQLGAVDAMNLDGGGSTAMAVMGRVVNRPSDGHERRVSNVLLVTR